MYRVVLIDTGVINGYEKSQIIGGCSVITKGETFVIEEGYKDYIGHGTAAADIIIKNAPDVEIYIVRIYEEEIFISEDKLVFALNYVKENLTFDIIQISSGLLTYSSELHDVIKQIVNDGNKLVISAFDNEGGISYPAAFKEVIGIDINPEYRKKEQYDYVEDGIIDVRGANAFFRVPWSEKGKNIVNGTSFLTSYFTAWIVNNCEGIFEKKHVCNCLKENAIRVYPGYSNSIVSSTEFVGTIKKAITFPFNKEVYCLAAFEDELPFEVVGYYDIKHKFLVGKKICDVLKYTTNESIIQNVENIDWSGDFDTVICGHLSEIEKCTKKDYMSLILEQCHKHGKKAYVFDDLGLRYADYKNTENIFSPIIVYDGNLNNQFEKLRTCNTPVLAVLGTSSRQGKYTIQLNILNEFKRRSIKADGIATEPTGALFGFSEMYPCGYGSNNLSGYQMLRVLNDMVYRLESQGNEIIISGGQSGTIPYDLRHESLISLDQHTYLMGLNPDGAILCINEFDDFDYVKKTINYIEAVSAAEVFAIIVSPARNSEMEGNSTTSVISKLKEEYGDNKSFYELSNLDTVSLVDNIMRYYA